MTSCNKLICVGDFKYKNQLTLTIYLIDKCNYNCIYCYNKRPRSYTMLNVKYLIKFIEYIHNINNQLLLNIEILGGEPTLHQECQYLCNWLQSKNYIKNILLYTNLIQSYIYYESLLFNSKLFLVITHHYHQIQNTEQHFFNTLISLYLKFNNQIQIRLMYEKQYLSNIINTFDSLTNILLSKFNNINITIRAIDDDITTYDIKYQEMFNMRYKQWYQPNYNRYISFEYENHIINDIDIDQFFLYPSLTYKYSFKHWKCYAGQDYLYIHVDGNIYPCPDYFYVKKQPIGNIYMYKQLKYKPTLCSTTRCICGIDIVKQNIFKI